MPRIHTLAVSCHSATPTVAPARAAAVAAGSPSTAGRRSPFTYTLLCRNIRDGKTGIATNGAGAPAAAALARMTW
jgi:hypothetical protein